MEIKICNNCGKIASCIHTCSPQLIRTNLINSIDKINERLRLKEKFDDMLYINFYNGNNPVETKSIQDLIEFFINKGFVGEIEIDDDIGMIVINEEIYLNKIDFDFIKEYHIGYEDYLNLYQDYINYSILYDIKNKSDKGKLDFNSYYKNIWKGQKNKK